MLRHRVWQVPLCPPLAHTQDVSVFAMQSSSELPTSSNASFEVSCSARGELHLPGFCLEHTFPAFDWSTHSKRFFLPPRGEERPDVLCYPALSTLVPLFSFQLLVAL